jgi:nitrogenase molybdenum-iron protein alpha/beta subunit
MIEQLVATANRYPTGKAVLLPHVGLQPIEVERIKEFIARFGFEVLALPDLSTSLDGHLGEKQSALSSGGITVEEIKNLADAALVISVGASMQASAAALLAKNPAMRTSTARTCRGLEATDGWSRPCWRKPGITRPHETSFAGANDCRMPCSTAISPSARPASWWWGNPTFCSAPARPWPKPAAGSPSPSLPSMRPTG